MDTIVKPPKHLSREARLFWTQVCEEFALESHHLRLLELACRSWDRLREAREAIRREGACVQDRFGQAKPHPLLIVEKDSAGVFLRTIKALGLDVELPGALGRPVGKQNKNRSLGDGKIDA